MSRLLQGNIRATSLPLTRTVMSGICTRQSGCQLNSGACSNLRIGVFLGATGKLGKAVSEYRAVQSSRAYSCSSSEVRVTLPSGWACKA